MRCFGMWAFGRSRRVALALALVAVAAASCGSSTPEANDGTPAVGNGSPEAVTSAVGDFVQFADADFSGTDVDYVVEGLRRLAGALGTLGVGSPELLIDLRVAPEHLLLNPTSEATTEAVRAALVSAAGALDQAQGGGLGLATLAGSLRSDVPLPDQRDQVRELFQACARALQDLSVRN